MEIEAHCGSVNCLLTPKQLQSLIILLTAYQKAALYSTSDTALYNTATVNNRPMTEDDYKLIEQNLAEEVRRKNCMAEAQQYDVDYYHFSNIDNEGPGKYQWKFCKSETIFLYLDPSESMFRSVKGMNQSIDLQSSYSSSRLDTASLSSMKFFFFF